MTADIHRALCDRGADLRCYRADKKPLNGKKRGCKPEVQ
jgi:hypothetical protein